jgi:hypothetical protein
VATGYSTAWRVEDEEMGELERNQDGCMNWSGNLNLDLIMLRLGSVGLFVWYRWKESWKRQG